MRSTPSASLHLTPDRPPADSEGRGKTAKELVEPGPAPLQRLLDAAGYKASVRPGNRSMRLALQCPKGPATFTL